MKFGKRLNKLIIMKIKTLTLFVCLMIFSQLTKAQYSKDSLIQENTDTSKVIVFLDGKRIPQKVILPKIQEGSAKFIGGEWRSRQSILVYGEAYRYGVNFFITKTLPNTEN
ncbi:hypothetical protein [Carboxylicivirga caseinilyticus]|uniref:hypothetical protein n=1 Tax=Carboxylicivirga caseinilyticus TaxID=3417572 RepID=UPI003D3382E6|nr:hypothetical protein [Marinilabiliaceae bacterium A049]